jgi:hypothetical protein
MPLTHAQMKLACEIANIGLWTLDLDTDEVEFQGDSVLLRNVPAGKMEDRYKTIHPDDAKVMCEKLHAVSEEQPEYEMEYRAMVPNKTSWNWFYVKGKLSPGTRLMYGVGMDISIRKEKEELLKIQLQAATEIKDNIRNLLNNLKQN